MKAFAIFLLFSPLRCTAWPISLPSPSGFPIAWDNLELADPNRPDPFNSSHPRRIMVSHFYPIRDTQCARPYPVPFMPPCVAADEDNNIQGELDMNGLGNVTWPRGVFARLQLDVSCDVCNVNETTPFPTLLFGPGFNQTRLSYSAIAQQIASLGYEIIVMDHPYETDVVLFPDGQILYGRLSEDDQSNRTFALEVRRKDAGFVMDHFGINTTVYLGHSFGGAAAVDAQLWSPSVVASANLDGAFAGPAISDGVPRPVLAIGSASHAHGSPVNDTTWPDFFNAMASKHPNVWAKDLNVNGSQHNSFTDYSIIADVAHLRGNELLLRYFVGEITGRRMTQILRTYLGAFLNFTLHATDEKVLQGPSAAFSDVAFYN